MIPFLPEVPSPASPLAAGGGLLSAAAPGAGSAGKGAGSDFAGLLGAALLPVPGDPAGPVPGAAMPLAAPDPAIPDSARVAVLPALPGGKSLPPAGADLPLAGAAERAEPLAEVDPLTAPRLHPRAPAAGAAAWLGREQTLAEAPRMAATVPVAGPVAGRGLRAGEAADAIEEESGEPPLLQTDADAPAAEPMPGQALVPPAIAAAVPLAALVSVRSDPPQPTPATPAPTAVPDALDPAAVLALAPAVPAHPLAALPLPVSPTLPVQSAPLPVRAALAPIPAAPALPDAAPSEASDSPPGSASPASAAAPPSGSTAEAVAQPALAAASASASAPPPLAAAAPVPAATGGERVEAPRAAAAIGAQQEQSIAQVDGLREALRSARPEMTMRHAEFGFVSLRLEQAAPDQWRAVLASRDPGFVPAVQAALADRAITAAADSSAAQNGTSEQRYGASPNGGQGGHSPHLGHSGGRDGEAAPDHRRPSTAAALAARTEVDDEGSAGRSASPGGLFA